MIEANNQVTIAGEIAAELVSYEMGGKKYFITELLVSRLSGVYDTIPVIMPSELIDAKSNYKGKYVFITGQLRSYNKQAKENKKVLMRVFVRDISFADEKQNINVISLNGFVCREPYYKETPLGKEVTDTTLAVNRNHDNSTDYISCIFWNGVARYVSQLEIGTHLKISGRIQSRIYRKKCTDGKVKTKVAYEVSVSKFEVVEGEE